MMEKQEEDSQGKDLKTVPAFSGKEDDWPDWSFAFRAAAGKDATKLLNWAQTQRMEIDEEIELTEEDQVISKRVYKVLTQKAMTGEASIRLKAADDGCGSDAWRRIADHYEPKTRQRQRKEFDKLMKPTIDSSKSLLSNIETWENEVRLYKKRFNKTIDEDLMISVITSMSPETVKEHIDVNADKYSSYGEVREKLVTYLESKNDGNGPKPMDLGVIDKLQKQVNAMMKGKDGGKKGGWQSKGKDGKGKDGKDGKGYKGGQFKGKDSKGGWQFKGKGDHGKGKQLGKDGGKKGGWQQNSWSSGGQKQAPESINGYCNSCWAWGHPARACPRKQFNTVERDDASTIAPSDSASRVSSSQASASTTTKKQLSCMIKEEENDGGWLLPLTKDKVDNTEAKLVLATEKTRRVRLLLDTCAAGSVTSPSVGTAFKLEHKKSMPYRSATGDKIEVLGSRVMHMKNEFDEEFWHDFEVGDRELSPAGSLVASFGNITAHGHRVILDDETGNVIINKRTGQEMHFEKRNNIYETYVELIEASADRPVLVNNKTGGRPAEETRATTGGRPASSSGSGGQPEDETRAATGGQPADETAGGQPASMTTGGQPEQEETTVVTKRRPTIPSMAAVREHAPLHLPHRDWCDHCVRGRGRADPHGSSETDEPLFTLDYLFMGQKKDDRPLVGLNVYEKKSKMMATTTLPKKGVEHPYAEKWLAVQIENCGYAKALWRSDQEPAILALRKRSKALCQTQLIPEDSPVHDSKSNGAIEAANGVVEGLIRVHKDQLDMMYDKTFSSDHPIISWLIQHAGNLYTIYAVGADGKTPYERLHGHKMNKQMVRLGECVLYHPKRENRLLKMEAKFQPGLFCGIIIRSLEYLVSNDKGEVVKCRDIKQQPIENSISHELMDKLVGVPWQPAPGKEEVEKAAVTSNIELPNPDEKREALLGEAPQVREFYITKRLIHKFGKTDGCPVCDGQPYGAHSKQCRERVVKLVQDDPEEKRKYDTRQTLEKKYEDALGRAVADVPMDDQPPGETAQEDPGQRSDPRGAQSGEELPMKRHKPTLAQGEKRQYEETEVGQPMDLDDATRCLDLVTNEEDGYVYDELSQEDAECWDEITGLPLPPDKVKTAINDEIGEYDRFNVFEETTDAVCREESGRAPVSCRWKIINKGDESKFDIRARLLARQFKPPGWESVFAATPPLWVFRCLAHCAVTNGNQHKPRKLRVIDLKRAFFHAKADGTTFVKPPHLVGTDKCWRLLKSMYGTLNAAGEFQDTFNDTLTNTLEHSQGMSNPCLFYDARDDVRLAYHGDDVVAEGEEAGLDAFTSELKPHFDLVVKYTLGPEAHDDKHGVILNRCLTWTAQGILWEADPRHVELVVAELGLMKAKPVFTPGVKRTYDEVECSKKLVAEDVTVYRKTAARIGFLSMDRFDLLYASKECLRGMAEPKVIHVAMMKRIGRYLLYRPRMALLISWHDKSSFVDGIGDSDHAGDVMERKSTNGGVVKVGNNTVLAWSTTQGGPSLSSCESEWYGMLKTASEALAVQAGTQDLGDDLMTRVWGDSSAALGVAKRQGLGKLKHVESRFFWLQYAVKNKRLTVHKEKGTENVGDAMTKYLSRDLLERLMRKIGLATLEGRHPLAPKLDIDLNVVNYTTRLTCIAVLLRIDAVKAENIEVTTYGWKERVEQLRYTFGFSVTIELIMMTLIVVVALVSFYLGYKTKTFMSWLERKMNKPDDAHDGKEERSGSATGVAADVKAETKSVRRTYYKTDSLGSKLHIDQNCPGINGFKVRPYETCKRCCSDTV